LSDQGGPVETSGRAEEAAILAEAMKASGEKADSLTHPFHSYPARMHPRIAGALMDALAGPDSRVLDPFCGSGTVLIEARRRGLISMGVDLNPLAIRIAEVKTDLRNQDQRVRFLRTMNAIAERSEERVRERRPVRAPLNREQAASFDGHILKELAGLYEELKETENRRDRRALEMLFSAILQKFSRQLSDTSRDEAPRRLRKGLVTEFFVRKGEELVGRWAEFEKSTPTSAPRPRLLEGDARDLPELFEEQKNATLILSSPPYGGTYDYLDHHAHRLAWFGMQTHRLEKGEIGARRHLNGDRGLRRWDGEMLKTLESMTGVLSNRGCIVLLVGDGQLGRLRVDAAEQLHRLAPEVGLRVEARAAQRRRDWTGRGSRKEHLVMLKAARSGPVDTVEDSDPES